MNELQKMDKMKDRADDDERGSSGVSLEDGFFFAVVVVLAEKVKRGKRLPVEQQANVANVV